MADDADGGTTSTVTGLMRALERYDTTEKVQALADDIGRSASTVFNWKSGLRQPAKALLLRLAPRLGLTPEEALGPAGAVPDKPTLGTFTKKRTQFDVLPIVAEVGAGSSVAVEVRRWSDDDVQWRAFSTEWLRAHGGVDRLRMVSVAKTGGLGDSMDPTIRAGALLVIDISPVRKFRAQGDIYVVRVHDEGAVVKRVFPSGKKGQQIVLWADNPAYTPRVRVVDIEDGEEIDRVIVGRVVWIGQEEV